MEEINLLLDPLLIAPYRLLDNPVLAWWLGTIWVAGWSIVVGELTLALGKRINRRTLDQHAGEAKAMQEKSLEALKAGDKDAYKAMNRLANESFGRTFFQRAALGAAALWPLFLVAGWMQRRFAGLDIPLWGDQVSVGWLQGLIVCYLVLRLGLALFRRQARKRHTPRPTPAPEAKPPE